MQRITIDVVSDIVCPWCYLGKARLDLAIAEVQDEIGIDINWRPYQLNPDYPPEGVDHQKVLAEKLGGKANLERAHANLRQYGQEVGINYNFEAIKIGPNTLDAHRLIHWAGTESREMQARVVDLLFKANFEEARNVGDRAVLLDIAVKAGLDAKIIGALLDGDADKDLVKQEISAAQQMGVNGVPFFIFDQRYAVSGAQAVETLVGALKEIAMNKAEEQRGLN